MKAVWKLFAESPFCVVMHARLAKPESLWISPRPLDEAIVIRLRICVYYTVYCDTPCAESCHDCVGKGHVAHVGCGREPDAYSPDCHVGNQDGLNVLISDGTNSMLETSRDEPTTVELELGM